MSADTNFNQYLYNSPRRNPANLAHSIFTSTTGIRSSEVFDNEQPNVYSGVVQSPAGTNVRRLVRMLDNEGRLITQTYSDATTGEFELVTAYSPSDLYLICIDNSLTPKNHLIKRVTVQQ